VISAIRTCNEFSEKGDNMNKIKKTVLAAILILLIFPVTSQAKDTSIEINVNNSDVEVDIETQFHGLETPLAVGAGFIYCDDYWISNLHMTIIDEAFIPALNLGLGFRAVVGEVEIHDIDYDLGALCFELLGGYDFRKSVSKLPISVSARVSAAPKVLSFRDAERYVEFNTSVSFHINNNASVFAGYRLIDFRFEDPVDTDWDDDAVFLGFRLSF